jgi:hypothetical protein
MVRLIITIGCMWYCEINDRENRIKNSQARDTGNIRHTRYSTERRQTKHNNELLVIITKRKYNKLLSTISTKPTTTSPLKIKDHDIWRCNSRSRLGTGTQNMTELNPLMGSPVFSEVCVARSLDFCVLFCR